LERYAEKIGALGKAELRVTRDRDENEEDERPQMRKSIVKNDDDDEDDWD